MADVYVAIGVRWAIVQNEFRLTLTGLAYALIELFIRPFG